jgi:hypothetical protein
LLRRWGKGGRKPSHELGQKVNGQTWTKHPLWIVINSPIVVLITGAAIIGGIGALFAANQKCMSDAEATVERHKRLVDEILERRSDFAQAILDATSVAQLKTLNDIKNAAFRYTYFEFQGRTLRELEDEEIRLGYKLDIPSTPALKLQMEFAEQRLQAAIEDGETATSSKSAEATWKMLQKQDISSATNKDMSALQAAAQKQMGWIFQAQVSMVGMRGVPACGFANIASRLLTGYPTYIAHLVPWLTQ